MQKPVPVAPFQRDKGLSEKSDHEGDDNDRQAHCKVSSDESETSRNAEIETPECKHHRPPIAAARMAAVSAICPILPAAPDPPPNKIWVIVGTITMFRTKAMKTAITP